VGKIQRSYFRQVSSASLLDVSAGNLQRTLVDESGMIRNQMRTHNRSEIVAVLTRIVLCVHPTRINDMYGR
jgi:hypothetical protein